MDRGARWRALGARRRGCQEADEPAAARTVAGWRCAHGRGAQHALQEHHSPARPAPVSGRHRTRNAHREHPALECGGYGAASLRQRLRRRRPHRHLSFRLHHDGSGAEPHLSRQERRLRRRSGAFSGAHLARHLRPRLPRGQARGRGTRQLSPRTRRGRWPAFLSAPAPDALVLADAVRQHGAFYTERHLSGALRQVSGASRPQGQEWRQDMDLHRRWRVGRAGGARHHQHRRPRAPRQLRAGGELQPATPRWPGARQRQDHPRARAGLSRRRLARHQGDLGRRLGCAARTRRGRHPRSADGAGGGRRTTRCTPSRPATSCASIGWRTIQPSSG